MQTKKKLVKVRQSQNDFVKLLFPPKNERRNFSQTFLQLLYGNRVFGNVYLSA